jgi:hypothetical protein
MKRLLMLLGVAVVAAAMYVAASPASQQAKGPTAKQFRALEKKVTALGKSLKSVKSEADAAVGIIGSCYLNVSGTSVSFKVMPVSQRGTPNTGPGFLYGTSGGSSPTTALDITPVGPQAYLQEVDPMCATATGLRHGAVRLGRSLVQHWARQTR